MRSHHYEFEQQEPTCKILLVEATMFHECQIASFPKDVHMFIYATVIDEYNAIHSRHDCTTIGFSPQLGVRIEQ